MKSHRRLVPPAARANLHAQECFLVRDVERRAAPGTLIQHRGRERRHACLVGWIAFAARLDHQDHVDQRQLMMLDDENLEPVVELTPRYRGKRETTGRGKLWRFRAIE
jgi:hypothetical protein